jgi:hypothetical protein
VRGEYLGDPWWTYTGTKLETADTAKENLQFTGPPLLGSAAKLAANPVGESPTRGDCPVATVAISGVRVW